MDESITVERVRHALVVGRLDADGAAVLLAANLPPKRDRTYVVVGASSVDAMRRLDPWVVADLADEVRGDLCVVAPGFGSMGQDGTLPPARLLADRLGVEVTAADGTPIALADGSVFVPGRTAGWVSYRPGGRRTRVGARYPAPWWQDGLPEPEGHITHVPAGLWVRHADARERPEDPLLRQVPDLDRLYVVLGAPGELPPNAAAVAEVLRALPDEARDRAVLAWYGSGSLAGAMARSVAEELGAPVRMAHGVPGDGGLVYVDETGTACWRPFAVESVHRPGGAPVLERWVAPPALSMAEPGSFRLADGWRVDVVPRGLVVRPEWVRPNQAMLAGETGPTADIFFAADGPVPPEVLSAFDGLVRGLPADTRSALRVLPVDQEAEDALTGIEAADCVVPVPAPVPAPPDEDGAVTPPPTGTVVVTADGRIMPAVPLLTPVPAPTTTVEIKDGVLIMALADDPDLTTVTPDDADWAPTANREPEEIGFPSVAATTIAPSVAAPPGLPLPAPALASPRPPRQTFPAPPRPTASSATPAAAQAAALPPGHVATPPAQAAQPLPGRAARPSAPIAPPQAAGARPDEAAPDQAALPQSGPPAAPVARAPVPLPGEAASLPAGQAVAPLMGQAVVPAAALPSSGQAAPPPGQAAASSSNQAAAPASDHADTTDAASQEAENDAAESTVDSIAGLLPGRDTRRTTQPPAAAVSTPIEVPENARSTAAQRRAMRAKLGSRYDVATRAVTKLLSERPGLRFGAGDRAALLAELAVVRVFADDPGGRYDADFYVCLADGLRRLPTARTVVVRGIPADTDVRPESVIRLPTPVVAAPAVGASPVGPAEALIWTTTARRLDGLLDDEAPAVDEDDETPPVPGRSTDVVLSGHTRLRVLAVESAPVRRILLAEDGAAPEAALTRLRAAAAARPEAADLPSTSRWFGPLPAAG